MMEFLSPDNLLERLPSLFGFWSKLYSLDYIEDGHGHTSFGKEEAQGIDISETGLEAYPEFRS